MTDSSTASVRPVDRLAAVLAGKTRKPLDGVRLEMHRILARKTMRDCGLVTERAVARREQNAMIRGVVLGVAEMLRVCHAQDAAEHTLRGAGITRTKAQLAGAHDVDINEIDWRRVDGDR